MTTVKKILAWLAGIVAALVLAGYGFFQWYMGFWFAPLDHTPPQITTTLSSPAVLVFNKANGYVHKDALPAGDQLLRDLAKQNGWSLYITDNGAVMNAEQLALFDVVVWNNTSGTTLTEEQQQTFKAYLENGGGFVGIHAAGGDFKYSWSWYVNELIGAQFIGHTMSPQFQDADVLVLTDDPVTAHIESPWRVPQEEWYAFASNPREKGSEVLLALDEGSYQPGGARMDGEHSITWRHRIGKGRAFYTAIGHQGATYAIPAFRTLVEKAIIWAGDL